LLSFDSADSRLRAASGNAVRQGMLYAMVR
jgi:hypothetical protein